MQLLKTGNINEFNAVREEGNIQISLRNEDLSATNLRGINLHDADLIRAKFVESKLNGADLQGVKLTGADLSRSDLSGADLRGANLSEANLTKSILRGANLGGMIDFSKANLSGTDVRAATMDGIVNFQSAILHDVDFTGTDIKNVLVNLRDAEIRNLKGKLSQDSNVYLEALKTFSVKIDEQLIKYNITAKERNQVEKSMNDLVAEVDRITPPEIPSISKRIISLRLEDVVEKILSAFPTTSEVIDSFRALNPLTDITEVKIEEILKGKRKQIDRVHSASLQIDVNDANEWNIKGTEQYNSSNFVKALKYFDKALDITLSSLLIEEMLFLVWEDIVTHLKIMTSQ